MENELLLKWPGIIGSQDTAVEVAAVAVAFEEVVSEVALIAIGVAFVIADLEDEVEDAPLLSVVSIVLLWKISRREYLGRI